MFGKVRAHGCALVRSTLVGEVHTRDHELRQLTGFLKGLRKPSLAPFIPPASRTSRIHPGDPDFCRCKLNCFSTKFATLSPWSTQAPLRSQTGICGTVNGAGVPGVDCHHIFTLLLFACASRCARPVVRELFTNLCRRNFPMCSPCRPGALQESVQENSVKSFRMLRIFPAQDREELWNDDVTEETEHKWVKKKEGTGADSCSRVCTCWIHTGRGDMDWGGKLFVQTPGNTRG